jgi:hypothetical protein
MGPKQEQRDEAVVDDPGWSLLHGGILRRLQQFRHSSGP